MNSPAFLVALYWASGLIVLAVGLERLEHMAPCAKRVSWRDRRKLIIEALFWASLCIGAAGAIITPLLPIERPTLQSACALVGIAGLILCGRLRGYSCPT